VLFGVDDMLLIVEAERESSDGVRRRTTRRKNTSPFFDAR